MQELLQHLLNNAETMGIVTILFLVILLILAIGWYINAYYQKHFRELRQESQAKSDKIDDLIQTLINSHDTLNKLTNTLEKQRIENREKGEATKKELLASIALQTAEIKEVLSHVLNKELKDHYEKIIQSIAK